MANGLALHVFALAVFNKNNRTVRQAPAQGDKAMSEATEADKAALFDWHVKRGSLMLSKRQHELTDEERAMMKTPPKGWSFSAGSSDWVFDPSQA